MKSLKELNILFHLYRPKTRKNSIPFLTKKRKEICFKINYERLCWTMKTSNNNNNKKKTVTHRHIKCDEIFFSTHQEKRTKQNQKKLWLQNLISFDFFSFDPYFIQIISSHLKKISDFFSIYLIRRIFFFMKKISTIVNSTTVISVFQMFYCLSLIV